MSFKPWQHVLCAVSLAAVAALPVQAATISFGGVAPGTLLFPGDSIEQNGFTFTAGDGIGVVDTAAAFGSGILDLAAPLGSTGNFYIGLNDSFVRMNAADNGTFRILGFDFAFVSALSNLFNPGDVPGYLIAAYEDAAGQVGGEFYSFGQADANGQFRFQSVGLSNAGSLGNALRSVDFYACTFDASGQCQAFNANFSQFALDNIAVPEPGALALALAALALTAAFTRRKA